MTIVTTGTLYVALELGCDKWVLASTMQAAQKPRFRTTPARNLAAFQEEIAKAKARFGLPADALVRTCYEAGRDGFWLHRALTKMGITNVVVDASRRSADAIGLPEVRAVRVVDPVEDFLPVEPVGVVLALALRIHPERDDAGEDVGALDQHGSTGVAIARAALAL